MWQPQNPIQPPDPDAEPLRPEEYELDVPPDPDAARPQLTCPLCGCQEFQQEKERTDTRWGLLTHVKTLMICRRCSYILQFYGAKSIFDFD
jgi:uncharacterized protein